MKITYLLSAYGKSGGFIVLYNFMDKLVDRGYDVQLILPNGKTEWEFGLWKNTLYNQPNPIINSIYSTYLKINSKSLKKIKYYYDLRKILNNLTRKWDKSDITISSDCLTAYVGYYLSDKTVSLYHMQHFEELLYQNKIERLIARNAYKLPLIKISNSLWLQNIIKKYFNENSHILNPGIDLEIYKPYINFKEKYYEKKEWTIVSFFDQTRKWKGFNDAVKAIKIVREHFKDMNITINWKVFGHYPPLKEYDTEFDYVGPVFGEDLAKLYSKADIVLLASWYESFPLPPIEAMACGSLIITTQYGTEDYVFDKINGLVSLPRKIEDIAKKIIYAIENPQKSKKMVKNGLNTAKEYSWEKRADVLEEILFKSIESYSFNNFKLFDDLVEGNFKEYMYDEFK